MGQLLWSWVIRLSQPLPPLVTTPALNLAPHRLESPLNTIYANRERVDQVEALGVLGENGLKVSAEGHIRAHKDSEATAQREAQALVVRVANSYGKTTPLYLGLKIEDAEHLHAVGRDSAFFIDYADVAKA